MTVAERFHSRMGALFPIHAVRKTSSVFDAFPKKGNAESVGELTAASIRTFPTPDSVDAAFSNRGEANTLLGKVGKAIRAAHLSRQEQRRLITPLVQQVMDTQTTLGESLRQELIRKQREYKELAQKLQGKDYVVQAPLRKLRKEIGGASLALALTTDTAVVIDAAFQKAQNPGHLARILDKLF